MKARWIKPFSIGRLAIFSNRETCWYKIGVSYFRHPFGVEADSEFWKDWGTYNLKIVAFSFVLSFEYSYGRKIKSFIKPYMV